MIAKIKSLYFRVRREVRFVWGRQWKLRSLFVPNRLRCAAESYLHEHADKMFFVFGTGRSGTQLLTDMLSLNGEASVYHEPNFGADVGTMDILRREHWLVLDYWRKFRSLEVYSRWKSVPEGRLYGEVNGTIRYQAPAIREMYPKAKLFLVSRDGRGVVRSVMGWPQFYSPSSKGAYAIEPLKGDPYFRRWHAMTRFEKICWAWMDTNELLMRTIPQDRWLQLEKIASDYEYCKGHLIDPLGIHLSYDDWQQHVSKKSRNATRSYAFPAWEE